VNVEDIVVEVRDKTLTRVGVIRPQDLNITASDQHNNVGDWSLSLGPEHPLTDALTAPGAGIIVSDTNDVMFSGPVTTVEWTASGEDPNGTVTISGVTDTVILADMLAYPDPAHADSTAQTQPRDERTGIVEDLMYAFVNANIGPSAPSPRKRTNLTLGTNGHRGPTTTKSVRFDKLGEVLKDLGATGGLGFRIVQRGTSLVFETYAMRDQSPFVRFDILNRTLASHKVTKAPPGVTRVIVAGTSGSGDTAADAVFYEGTNAAATAAETAWGRRIETVVNQSQTDDPAEYSQAANEALAKSGFSQVAAEAVASDDLAMVYGVDWRLGDTVAVIADGAENKSVVTGYAFKASAEGTLLGAVLGDPGVLDGSTQLVNTVKDLGSRVSYLETSTDSDSGWKSFTPNGPVAAGSVGCKYRLRNGVLFVKLHIAYSGSWAANFVIGTLPVGYRPTDDFWIPAMFFPNNGTNTYEVKIQANGQIISTYAVPAGFNGCVAAGSTPL
jgi:hypothetical protein